MSLSSYFILSKAKALASNNNDTNQFISTISDNMYFILPRNNIKYHIDEGLFESHLIEWSKQYCNPDKIFLDIGAHTGTYAISLSKYSKHVIAFEPQRMTYYALCGSVALSNIENITCLNFGLGSQEQVGITQLNIISPDGGGSSICNNSNNKIIKKENIEIKTLDSLTHLQYPELQYPELQYPELQYPELQYPELTYPELTYPELYNNIGFIKMDIEDNELECVKGAKKTLLRNNRPPILFESNINSPTRIQLFEYITHLGYKIIPIAGIANMFLAN
jgi:FkbM family methyltransferase